MEQQKSMFFFIFKMDKRRIYGFKLKISKLRKNSSKAPIKWKFGRYDTFILS